MITLPALGAIPWRLIGYGLAVVAVLALGWRVHAWREGYLALPAAQEALQREQTCSEGSECLKRAQAAQAQAEAVTATVVQGYEKELADIRSKPIPTRVIRVCREAGTGAVRVPADSGEPAGTAPAGMVSGTDEFDTRPLRELAKKADEISGGYRWLRNRDDALATKPMATAGK